MYRRGGGKPEGREKPGQLIFLPVRGAVSGTLARTFWFRAAEADGMFPPYVFKKKKKESGNHSR